MATVQTCLRQYATMAPDVLKICYPHFTCDYNFGTEGVYRFVCTDPEEIIEFLTNGLLETVPCQKKRYDFQYPDGTVAKFVKYRNTWDLKRYKKLIGQIVMDFN